MCVYVDINSMEGGTGRELEVGVRSSRIYPPQASKYSIYLSMSQPFGFNNDTFCKTSCASQTSPHSPVRTVEERVQLLYMFTLEYRLKRAQHVSKMIAKYNVFPKKFPSARGASSREGLQRATPT